MKTRATFLTALTALTACWVLLAVATATAQPATPPPPPAVVPGAPAVPSPGDDPPPLWDTQVGASFVGTSGNTDTTTVGADFSMHRRWPNWQIGSMATVVRASSENVTTADRYMAEFRAQRKLTEIVGLSGGERGESDHLAGIDFRSVADFGLTWAVVHSKRWTLDAITAAAWDHERPTLGTATDHPTGLFQAASRIPLGASSELTQRLAFYPDFEDSSAYRSEADLAVQASINNHLALKMDYLWQYSHEPVAGFKRADSTTTASLVLRWRSRP